MHKMNDTPRTLTIIGLVFDVLGVFGIAVTALSFKLLLTEEFFESIVPPEEMGEVQGIIELYQIIGNIALVFAMFLAIILVINLIVNIKLIKGKVTEEKAKLYYTYQLFIGIVLLLINTISGIVYIISGIKGRDNEPDRISTREGI